VEGNPSKIGARAGKKGGAKVLVEDEKLRHVEILFSGDCEGSIAAARDDHLRSSQGRGRRFAGPRSWRICDGRDFFAERDCDFR